MPETEKPKAYEPKDIEQKWYDFWLANGYFRPEINSGGEEKNTFCIVIPPPNVTGSLHMGHALNATIQDILVRWKRMQGYRSLWVPGTDHAGIATQNVVERQIAGEGTDRHKLGREEFINRVWKWKAEYGGRIIYQLKKMGASCDWSRERFTLDEGLSEAVRTVFVKLYEEGLIYRSTRLINWCPRCRTALSDLEVEHDEEEGLLTYVRYPLSGEKGHIVVATTRPETMLGDTAVAVNPDDERYKDFIGKTIELPLTCRRIPIVADAAVDPAFGTGAVKVTPAHDFNDEEIAKRQNPPLESVVVIGAEGRMAQIAGARYAGLDRYECRKLVVEDLKAQGLLEKEEKYRHSIGHCYRCKTVIEPLATPQWYVKVEPLAREAIRAVREKRVRIVPDGWENSYFAWMENIKDWCISRQIWWGHRIPVWYCRDCNDTIAAKEPPARCNRCSSTNLEQDPDVLDTWFSSALWPFSTLGWPEKTPELSAFYPTDVLVTAFDILFFWVARMLMMGLKFMGDVPFRDVYIHALVRDQEGQKMSKSKGNVVDPLTIIDKYGTDAFRFTLAAFAAQGRDIKFSEERVKGYRHFINKLWNASKFIMMNTSNGEVKPDAGVTDLPSRWIMSRFAQASEDVNTALREYRFNDAAQRAYSFLWHEFCDWYIEMAKTGLQQPEHADGVRKCLIYTLEGTLRLLHPFMPFVTEEIWQQIPASMREKESVMLSPYPKNLAKDAFAEENMGQVMEAVTGVRTIRGELNISPAAQVRVLINASTAKVAEALKTHLAYIKRLAGAAEVVIETGLEKPPKTAISARPALDVYVPVEGLINIGAEIERLEKELRKTLADLDFCMRKLMDEDFVKKAPEKVVLKEKAKCEELEGRRDNLNDSINKLRSLEV